MRVHYSTTHVNPSRIIFVPIHQTGTSVDGQSVLIPQLNFLLLEMSLRSFPCVSSVSREPDSFLSLTWSSAGVPLALAVDSAWSQAMHILRMIHHLVFSREWRPSKFLTSLAERFRTPILWSLESMPAIVVALEVGPSRIGTTAFIHAAFEYHSITIVHAVDPTDRMVSRCRNVRYSLRYS